MSCGSDTGAGLSLPEAVRAGAETRVAVLLPIIIGDGSDDTTLTGVVSYSFITEELFGWWIGGIVADFSTLFLFNFTLEAVL
jgi:hypothetical protein